MNLRELGCGDVSVNLRRRKIRVPEHGLDEPDVGAVFQHVGGAGMAEEVTGARRLDSSALDVSANEVAQTVFHEGFTEVRHEQGARSKRLY